MKRLNLYIPFLDGFQLEHQLPLKQSLLHLCTDDYQAGDMGKYSAVRNFNRISLIFYISLIK